MIYSHGIVSLGKVLGALLPGTLYFAVGVDGIANNPITLTDLSLTLAGLSLIWFATRMLKTADDVKELLSRVRALEDTEKARKATKDLATALSEARDVADEKREHPNR